MIKGFRRKSEALLDNLDVCLLPTRQEFVDWAKSSMLELGKRPSQFLGNGLPSGKNRTSVLLASQKRLNMELARQLQTELCEEARRQGKRLTPLIEAIDGLASE